jgi:hypothetical protein
MPLSPPGPRTALHHRRIDFRGYRRDDGLFDIECRLVDTRGFDVQPPGSTKTVVAGDPMHDMSIRLLVTDDLEVRAIEACSDATPFEICPEAAGTLQAVKGLRIGPGWSRAIKERLGGVASCTHLAEMLVAMGTAAYQSIVPYNRIHGKETDGFELEKKIDSCFAYAAEGPVVRRLFPRQRQRP